MFIRKRTVRSSSGREHTYLELARTYRKDGKVCQERLCSLGRLDELRESGNIDRMIASLVKVARHGWIRKETVQLEATWSKQYGVVVLVRRLWRDLGLAEVIGELYRSSPMEIPVEEGLVAMITNRLVDPRSKLITYRWIEGVYAPEWERLDLSHLYRALDFLDEHIRTVEEALFMRSRDLFSLEVDLVLFDTTSTYFEGRGPEGLARLGYSRDKRPDLVQVVIGVLMTREGIPVAHYVFPGNTADIAAFRHAVKDVKERFPLRQVIIVADRGVVSESLLEALEAEGREYIVGIPLRKWKAADEVLKRAGRYHKVAENLEVKEVEQDGKRYVLCYNPEQAERDRKERASFVAQIEAELARGGLGGLARKKGYGRYLKVLDEGRAEMNWGRVRREERYDGKYLLRTSATLPPAEIAQAYKGLWRVEQGFRELKSGLEMRPCYHWTLPRVRGHIALCFLALVMGAALKRLLRTHGCEASVQEVLEAVEQVKAVRVELNGEVLLARTELPPLAQKAFAAVGMRPPPKVQSLN
ncbi:MAG: hypothetical protein DDT34_02376 [Firmicutes bacterium]|nr:hypothetical protein [Bacillota bacterium]